MANYISLQDVFGFNMTLPASQFNQLAENVIAITEQASGAPEIKIVKALSYTGNGSNSQNVTGVGFTPTWGFVFGGNVVNNGLGRMCYRTSAMSSNQNFVYISSVEFYSFVTSKGLTGFIEDGFTVKNTGYLTTSGKTFYTIMGRSV